MIAIFTDQHPSVFGAGLKLILVKVKYFIYHKDPFDFLIIKNFYLKALMLFSKACVRFIKLCR